MATRDQQDHQRPSEIGLLEQRGEEVGLEVVDPDERDPPRQRERLGLGDPDQERADEPGAVGHRHRVDAGPGGVRTGQLSASATTGVSSSTWARPASSGTTPP